MKKIFLLLAVIIFASCSSGDDAGDAYTSEFEQIKITLPEGQWMVSTFIDGQIDKTSAFESFDFTFNADGTVIGKTDLFSKSGTWAYDNTSTTSENLVLLFGDTDPFPALNGNWKIVSLSNSKVELSDDKENGETELLTFTKL